MTEESMIEPFTQIFNGLDIGVLIIDSEANILFTSNYLTNTLAIGVNDDLLAKLLSQISNQNLDQGNFNIDVTTWDLKEKKAGVIYLVQNDLIYVKITEISDIPTSQRLNEQAETEQYLDIDQKLQLDSLSKISQHLLDAERPLELTMLLVIETLSTAFHYNHLQVRIEIEDEIYGNQTPVDQLTNHYKTNIRKRDTHFGEMIIWYDENNTSRDIGPFSFQEIRLVENISQMIANFVDIQNKNKRLEKQEKKLQQNVKLEALGRLAGGISHDFNNLLTIIKGYTDISLGNIEDEDLIPLLKKIQGAVTRGLAITDQLLAFRKENEVQPEELELIKFLREILPILKDAVGEEVTINLEIKEVVTDCIKFDPASLERILINLVINADEAMEDGGTITIGIEGNHSVNEVILYVSDTGIGMTEETCAKIFDPFFTTKDSGSGLGLSSVHGLITQQNGRINVTSEVLKGTKFYIHLPLC